MVSLDRATVHFNLKIQSLAKGLAAANFHKVEKTLFWLWNVPFSRQPPWIYSYLHHNTKVASTKIGTTEVGT